MIHKNLSRRQVVERIIHHELGHWFMSRYLEFGVGGIKIGQNESGQLFGSATVYPLPKIKLTTSSEVYDHLMKRICVLCAGVISDIEWHRKFASKDYEQADTEYLYSKGLMDETGLSDKGKIEELLYIMNNIVNEPCDDIDVRETQLNEIFSYAWSKTAKFIEGNDKLFAMGDKMIMLYFNSGIREFDYDMLVELEGNS